jgi:hypothetical protein
MGTESVTNGGGGAGCTRADINTIEYYDLTREQLRFVFHNVLREQATNAEQLRFEQQEHQDQQNEVRIDLLCHLLSCCVETRFLAPNAVV